jgi:hypothetical protein
VKSLVSTVGDYLGLRPPSQAVCVCVCSGLFKAVFSQQKATLRRVGGSLVRGRDGWMALRVETCLPTLWAGSVAKKGTGSANFSDGCYM